MTSADALGRVDAAVKSLGDLTDVKHVEIFLKPDNVGFVNVYGPWHVLKVAI